MVDLLPSELAEMEEEDAPEEGMSDHEYRSAIVSLCSDAENWLQQDVSPERERAHRYYNGECDLPAQKGRSQFVMRVVRDTIEQTIPQMMRIFTGGTDVVAFRSGSMDPERQQAAQDATDTVSHIFWNLNPGWLNMQDFVRDALKAKMGWFKVYEKEETRVQEREFNGPYEEFVQIAGDESIEVVDVSIEEIPGVYAAPQVMVSATVRRKSSKKRICVETVATEEMLVDRGATSTDYGKFKLIGQKSTMMVSDVVEMGVDFDLAMKHAGSGDVGETSGHMDQERRARRGGSTDSQEEQTTSDKATQSIVVYELYVRLDRDEDGFAELRRVVGIGEGPAEIVEDDICDDHPYCGSPAIAIEHNVIGESMADNVMDLQDVETQITRQVLNNLVLVNNPRQWGLKGQYDRQSLLDNKVGGVVEVKSPNAVGWDVTPFIGDKALLIREAFNETRAERTGITKESMGLAAQHLQASSEVGVLAVMGAGKTQPEMIAATIAHRALVPMARKILALVRSTQNGEEGQEGMSIRKSGEYRQVNPKDWPEDMELDVMVGLGTGSRDENLVALQMLKQEQKEILLTVGPDNPICTMEQYSHTLSRIVQLTGVGPSTSFFNSPEMVKQEAARLKQEAAQKPPPPDPKMEAVKAKAAADQAKLQADTDLGKKKAQADAMLKQEAQQQDAQIKMQAANTEAQSDMQKAVIEIEVERQVAAAKLAMEERMRTAEMLLETRLAEMQMAMEAQTQQRADINIDRQ
jgi:hypothetical protein